MRNAFRLKNIHDCIHISHSMTKEEWEANKELLQEARKRNNAQSSKNFVFKVNNLTVCILVY